MNIYLKTYLLLFIALLMSAYSVSDKKVLIEKTQFSYPDLQDWKIELQNGEGTVSIKDKSLDIDVPKGATVWYKEKLQAPIIIEYEVTVVDEGREHERVSDLNCFWMATDPRCPDNIFACNESNRSGTFTDYHQLKTYYVGYGGNNNSTTRFRRYIGTGERPLLPEHDLGNPHLLIANKKVKVKLTAINGKVSYSLDGQEIFQFTDPQPLTEGYFAFRTVANHMRIHNFKISKPKN